MSVDKAAKPQPPRTLMQAHDALVRVRPSSDASLKEWHSFYERSVALYLEIAEIDRGHHHEALYVRHEALGFRMEVRDLCRRVVAATG